MGTPAAVVEPDVSVTTIGDLPFHVMGRLPKPMSIGRCGKHGIDGLSSKALFERVRDVSLGLGELGITSGDRVAILAESRPEWLITDLAVLAAGIFHDGITTPDRIKRELAARGVRVRPQEAFEESVA